MGNRVIMTGATGAVGTEVVRVLVGSPDTKQLTLLGRRVVDDWPPGSAAQQVVDVLDPASYETHLAGHDSAICTLGVGQPSTVSRDQFVRIDKTAVLQFARTCRRAGVLHFQLLASVGADSGSRSFYLRTKGELEDGLRALEFERLSLFHPSMILTPTNRYGLVQGLTLKLWPLLGLLMLGPLSRYRGVPVGTLGAAIANNLSHPGAGEEILYWSQFESLAT